jgi:predicted KAP-like P-loop ATPase
LKCADDLVLLAKDKTVLQITIDELVEVGRRYGMECGKNRS